MSPDRIRPRFLETHVAFEAHSDQQGRIIQWFEDNVEPATPTDEPYRVLSVGCGSGLLDVPVSRHLAARGARLTYTGVNPNEAECTAFARRFTESGPPSARLELARMPFEDFETDTRFDLVHFVQSLYYVDDPSAALERARQLLAPGGKLVVFHAPLAALNQLAMPFYDRTFGRPTMFAEDVSRILLAWNEPFTRERIDAHLEVTPFVQRDAELGRALRDFIVQVESAALPRELQELIDDYLDAITVEGPDDRAYIAHPVDAFVVHVE